MLTLQETIRPSADLRNIILKYQNCVRKTKKQ